MIKYDNIKRLWIITDTHLGIRNNSELWINIQQDYFFNYFIPEMKKRWQPGDALFHMGDVFDSRQSLNLKVLNLGIRIFEELSTIFNDGIFIIAGNHDCYAKSDTEINSINVLKWIPNLNIYLEPESLQFGPKKCFLMPWRKDHETEGELLSKTPYHDYLFCHTDINGMKHNKFSNVPHGISYKKLDNFERVYSGHIHYSQLYGKVRMLGSPYELTRADADNPKSFMLVDLSSGEETYFKNNYSPRFIRINLSDVLQKTPPELEKIFNNNFVDVIISSKVSQSQLDVVTQMIKTQRDLKFITETKKEGSELDAEDVLYRIDGMNFSITDIMEKYISSMESESDENKDKIIKTLKALYNKVTKKQEEINETT